MPSFLSKVFGRKKDGKGSPPPRGRASDGSLLDGKFEAVSAVNSPSATEFPENALGVNSKERDTTFGGLFKVKSRPSRASSPEPSKREDFPQLSLVLPVPKDDAQARTLGVVFEADPDVQILTDDAIGNKTLSPLEALILVRTCSQAIVARGLETLGLMHPHWYSASPDVQRRLISLFIRSLNPNNAITTLSPNSLSSTSIFESEINYTRSPHDVVAVLRWGLRHLGLGGGKFGKDESWYKTFSEAERSSDYLPNSYSEKLAPLIPPAHLELLNVTLDLFSSLAAHADRNSTSASKLARAFGFWLLAAQRVGENDDWQRFYARWQHNGRILEHLLLARIRDESLRLRMPTRLTELVVTYPYVRGATPADDILLPPRVSTRHFNALFVRVETEFASPREKAHRHPLQLLKDALAADVAVGENELSALWEKIRGAGNDEKGVSPGGYPGLSQAFADETIRYLTLVPGDHSLKKVTSFTFGITEISQETPSSRRYASSPGSPEAGSSDQTLTGTTTTNGHLKPASDPSPLPSALNSSSPTDWVQFSSAGFSDASTPILLASTLFGQDVEKTNPPLRKASRISKVPPLSRNTTSPRRKSVDITTPRRASVSSQSEPTIKLPSKSFPVSVVEIDEAFIEFWVDALLDPVSSTWPKFVICRLRSSLSDLINDKRIQYLIVEHVFVPKPAPPALPVEVAHSQPIEIARDPSRDDSNVALSPGRSSTKSETRRLFGFFSSSGRHSLYSSPSTKGKKKASPQAHNVSELGEVLEDSGDGRRKSSSSTVRVKIPSPKSRKSVDAGKSVEVPKQVAEKDEVAAEKKEEENLTSGTVAVADAAAVALASAAAEEKDNALATTVPPVAGTGAAEGSQFVEDLPESAGGAKPQGAQLEDEPVTAVELVNAEERPPPVSEEVATQAPVTNGHTLATITEKAEDANVTTPAPLPPTEPVAETTARDELLVTTSALEPEISAEGVSSATEELAAPSALALELPPVASVEELEVKAEEAIKAAASEPAKVGAAAEEVPTPAVETVLEKPAESIDTTVEELSVPVPASEEVPVAAEHLVSVEQSVSVVEQAVPAIETHAPVAVEEPAATYEDAPEVDQDTPNVADGVPAVPLYEDHVADNDFPVEQVAIVEETAAPAVEEADELGEVIPVGEASPASEEPVTAPSTEPTVVVEEVPEPEATEEAAAATEVVTQNEVEAPTAEATHDSQESEVGPGPAEPETTKAEGTIIREEAPISSHDVEEPIEDVTATRAPVFEPPTHVIEQADQSSEAVTAATNGNGFHHTVALEKATPLEPHVDSEHDSEPTTPTPEDMPEKLSEVIVEDD